MKITILNRQDVLAYKPEDTAIWISVSEPGKAPPDPRFMKTCYLGRLNLYFDDVLSDEATHLAFVPMTDEQAQTIVEFVLRYKDEVKEMVFNCEAGMSRSAGMAAAVCIMLGISDDICYQKPRHPNIFVKNKILKAWNKLTHGLEQSEFNTGPH